MTTIGSSPSDLQRAADALAAGKLVAFPTETVYGLGGNALLDAAARHIYEVKGRPATDPLICHMDTLEKAAALWDPNWDPAARELAATIGRVLWPGPLTIVCKANPRLPNSVTGGSGFVGARIPRHPVTLALLKLVDFPVAGPSANTFGHVSPTTPQHVIDDLAKREPELLVIDGGSCAVGIESTVIKVVNVHLIEVLRRGRTSVDDIQRAMGDLYSQTRVEVRDTRSKFRSVDVPMDGPGQMLTHYSPGIPASLISPASVTVETTTSPGTIVVCRGESRFPISKTLVLDFNGLLGAFKEACLGYRDLSQNGNAEEACFDVFEALRWSERVIGAENVVFPFLSEWTIDGADRDLLGAVEDRLFRAASGTVAFLATNGRAKNTA